MGLNLSLMEEECKHVLGKDWQVWEATDWEEWHWVFQMPGSKLNWLIILVEVSRNLLTWSITHGIVVSSFYQQNNIEVSLHDADSF